MLVIYFIIVYLLANGLDDYLCIYEKKVPQREALTPELFVVQLFID